MDWEVIDTGVGGAEENMRYDARLLEEMGQRSRPVLHFYEWEGKAATYGYFLDPVRCLDLAALKRHNITIARRPTGGGVVFHFWDMAFSVLVPALSPAFSQNTLANYNFVNTAVLKAVQEFLGHSVSLTPTDFLALDAECRHFCMAKPTKYDVVWQGKKIAGAAQRKTRLGFLHQGTIALCVPEGEVLKEILLPGTQVAEAMKQHTFALLGKGPGEGEIREAKVALKRLLTTHLSQVCSILPA